MREAVVQQMSEIKSLGKDIKKSVKRYTHEFNSFIRSLGELSIEFASTMSSEFRVTGNEIRRKSGIVIHSPILSPNADHSIETIEETCWKLNEDELEDDSESDSKLTVVAQRHSLACGDLTIDGPKGV